jgi:hypothetical protein
MSVSGRSSETSNPIEINQSSNRYIQRRITYVLRAVNAVLLTLYQLLEIFVLCRLLAEFL